MNTEIFVGLDWAVHTHAVCVIDAAGAVLERFEIAHDRDGLAELMRRLARFGQTVRRIAIERPSGLIVDALVEAGHHVFPIPDVFAGLDWAVHTHAVCVIDTSGAVRDRFEIAHDREGLAELMRRLARFGARVRIAIERPSGLIVDALVEAGHHVFPIHPNAVKASRPRYRSHGAKSDASDAYLLADLLRTDGHRWRELSPQSDSIRALRALVRSRDDLVATRVALGNQLRSTLEAFWPGAACIFADITSPIGLAFLKRYPSPASAARLSEATLRRFCRTQHYSGRRSPAELLARLRSAAGPGRPAHQRGDGAVGALDGGRAATPGRTDRGPDSAHRALRRVAARRADHHVLPARRARLRRADPGRAG